MKDISTQEQKSMSLGLSQVPPRGFLSQKARQYLWQLSKIPVLQHNLSRNKMVLELKSLFFNAFLQFLGKGGESTCHWWYMYGFQNMIIYVNNFK